MITLPESVTISRKKDREAELYETARTWLGQEERAPGVHASGLLDPMLAYWQVKNPLPLPDRLVTMFMVGKVLHAFILGAYSGGVDINTSDGGSMDSSLGYTYSPDLVHNGMVREVKTSRSFYEPKNLDDVGMYVEQLLTYMAPTNTMESELWVLYLNLKDETGRTAPAFRCYSVQVTQADLDKVRTELAMVASMITAAVNKNDPSGLPLCRTWKCGARNCVYYDDCKPEGRYGTTEFDTGARTRAKKTTQALR